MCAPLGTRVAATPEPPPIPGHGPVTVPKLPSDAGPVTVPTLPSDAGILTGSTCLPGETRCLLASWFWKLVALPGPVPHLEGVSRGEAICPALFFCEQCSGFQVC